MADPITIAANITNTTLNATALTFSDKFEQVFLPNLIDRTQELMFAPGRHPEMLWMVFPLVTTLLLMQFYFGRYTKEELGWNTAVGNCLVLIFISVDLFRYIYNNPHLMDTFIPIFKYPLPTKLFVASLVFLEGFTLLFEDFFHKLPKKVAFFISSPLPVNLTAYVALAIVYSDIPFDWMTVAAGVFLFLVLLLFFWLVRLIVPVAQGQWPKEMEHEEGHG